MRRGIALHTNIDERLGQLQADERKVRQVVLNLLSNAVKFTPEGGRIEVRVVPVDGAVEVSVADTGVGIAPGDEEAIFEEFRQVGTAAKKGDGTGLGLALSREFIELHGWRIWIQTRVGVGLDVHVCDRAAAGCVRDRPRAAPDMAPVSLGRVPAAHFTIGQSGRILLLARPGDCRLHARQR
jgi:light-regulated signal transduction histidine kinase (bacteriophytochrome)